MNQTTLRRGRLLLLAAVTFLVVLAGSWPPGQGHHRRAEPPGRAGRHPAAVRHGVRDVAKISPATAVAPCPAGTRAIDGGVSSDSEPFTRVDTSTADVDGTGWRVELWNQHPIQGLTAHVWAACLAIG